MSNDFVPLTLPPEAERALAWVAVDRGSNPPLVILGSAYTSARLRFTLAELDASMATTEWGDGGSVLRLSDGRRLRLFGLDPVALGMLIGFAYAVGNPEMPLPAVEPYWYTVGTKPLT